MTITIVIVLLVLAVIVGILVQRKNNVVARAEAGEKQVATAVQNQVNAAQTAVKDAAQNIVNKL
jgi:preprotein translocase subunit SecG